MGADLPPGRWSAWLVGAWWPAPPVAPANGVTHWRQAGEHKDNEARDLQNERSRLAVNRGRTADDLTGRYWRGEQRLVTISDQCKVKSRQSDRVADAVANLRDRLTDIAHSGNEDIDRILSGIRPIEAKVAAVNAVIAQSNADAASAGATAISNIIDATQSVLDATIGGSARTWLQAHDVNLDEPPPSRPFSAENVKLPSPPAFAYGGPRTPGATSGTDTPVDPPPALAYGGPLTPSGTSGGDTPSGSLPASPYGGPQGLQNPFPPGNTPPPLAPPPLQPGAPAVGVGGPSIPGVSTPAASAPPLSPQSLAQSFTNGMSTDRKSVV